MAKTLFYKLFGLGGMPANYKTAVESEGLVLFDEGVKSSVTYRDFRAPGRYSNFRRQWFAGSIALTKTRLLGLRGSAPVIDVPLDDPRIRSINFSVEGEETLLAAFDASLFHSDWSGKIEYRFRTPSAAKFATELNSRLR